MKVSLNVIKRFIDVDLSVDELVQKINQQLGQVEEVVDLTPQYKDVVIVKIITCEKHPDADRLSVCMVDDGGKVEGVERDENGHVQVVCGAPNARADIFAAWLPPKSTVPASYNDAEPFVLETREIRGVKSNGMMAAADELALGGDHTGIIEINPEEWRPAATAIVPGASFAEAFGLDDTIIDIENKMFTHRPDLFGQLGVAREIAGITGKQFNSPDWYLSPSSSRKRGSSEKDVVSSDVHDWIPNQVGNDERLELHVFNEAAEKCPRFMAVALKDVTVGPSPLWLQIELVRLGSKPINNVVDATNYVMLLTAQPTHAYDYDKLRGKTLGVRMAKEKEVVTLLNDKSYSLTKDDVVIVDGEGVVGLGGVMGGGNSEVSADTKNVVLEVAAFDMYAVRKTSMRHGLFTDAVTRFSKGQSPLQQPVILALLMQSVLETAGGAQASDAFDEHAVLVPSPVLTVDVNFVNERLGLHLSGRQMADLLLRVEFDLVDNQTDIATRIDELGVPFWRTDIELPEDIVEEVGRLYGFEKLPLELPQRSIVPAPENPVFAMKKNVRRRLKAAGASEVLTYSFVHERLITGTGQDSSQAFQLSNALSPDLQYYRLSVLPSLLAQVHPNIKAGHDTFALFEFGKAHRKGDLDDSDLPREYPRLAFVYAAKKTDKTAFYTARRYVNLIAPDVRFTPLESFATNEFPIFEQLAAPFEPNRAAVLMHGDKFVGVVGEFKASVRRAFKLPDATAGFEMFQSHLLSVGLSAYIPLSRYPSVTQDITLKVAAEVNAQELGDVVIEAAKAIQPSQTKASVNLVSVYQAEGSPTKNLTYRVEVASYEKTFTDAEVASFIDGVARTANERCGAERI